MTHKSDLWPGDPGYQINVQKIQAAISDMNTVTVRGGGQYTQVSARVEAFRRHVGANISIESEIVVDDGKRVVIKALVRRPDGFIIATGFAEEIEAAAGPMMALRWRIVRLARLAERLRRWVCMAVNMRLLKKSINLDAM